MCIMCLNTSSIDLVTRNVGTERLLMCACRPAVSIQGLFGKAYSQTRMWVNAQRDGRPAEYRWRPLFNALDDLHKIISGCQWMAKVP